MAGWGESYSQGDQKFGPGHRPDKNDSRHDVGPLRVKLVGHCLPWGEGGQHYNKLKAALHSPRPEIIVLQSKLVPEVLLVRKVINLSDAFASPSHPRLLPRPLSLLHPLPSLFFEMEIRAEGPGRCPLQVHGCWRTACARGIGEQPAGIGARWDAGV